MGASRFAARPGTPTPRPLNRAVTGFTNSVRPGAAFGEGRSAPAPLKQTARLRPKRNHMKTLASLLASALLLAGCSGGVNLFSLDQDRQLGAQVNQEILNNPQQYPVLPERGNEEVYGYVRGITDRILNSGNVEHRDEFAWEVRLIDDDETLNAFATPGGYIYVYTGLIKFLDTEDELAGVMGHEIAHADQRHSTKALTKQYGIQALAALAGGSQAGALAGNVLGSLLQLKFGRGAETEADTYSVIYLCPTGYEADGAAGFFRKMEAGGGHRPPEFLSTHPNPGNRVANIEQQAGQRDCSAGGRTGSGEEYQRIKRLL